MNFAKTLTATSVLAVASIASGGDGFEIPWHTIDAGGGTSTGAEVEVTGTIGQADTGVMTSASFEVSGGFWSVPDAGAVPCPADLDGSGDVGFADLLAVLSGWGACGEVCPEDLDDSGDVGFGDLLIVLSAWGPCQ